MILIKRAVLDYVWGSIFRGEICVDYECCGEELCVGWKFWCVKELTSNKSNNRNFNDQKFRDNLEIDSFTGTNSEQSSVPQCRSSTPLEEHKMFRRKFSGTLYLYTRYWVNMHASLMNEWINYYLHNGLRLERFHHFHEWGVATTKSFIELSWVERTWIHEAYRDDTIGRNWLWQEYVFVLVMWYTYWFIVVTNS